MRIYISNLSKYNEGESVGAWFTLPVDYEEVKEKIGLDCEHEEYAIHDYELPFDISESEQLDVLNKIYYAMQDIQEPVIADNIGKINDWFGLGGVLNTLQEGENFTIYNAVDYEDLAAMFVEDGYLGEIPENIINYIHYGRLGNDLQAQLNTLQLSGCIVEYTG